MKKTLLRTLSLVLAASMLLSATPVIAEGSNLYPFGDVTLDREADADDLTKLARAVGGIEALPQVFEKISETQYYPLGDLNCDADVSANDLTKLARLVGHIDTATGESFTLFDKVLTTKTETGYSLLSPDGKTAVNLVTTNGNIRYDLKREGVTWVNQSNIGVTAGGKSYYSADAVKSFTTELLPVRYDLLGNFSLVERACNRTVLTLDQSGYVYQLELRLFNDGFAFRYLLPSTGKSRQVSADSSTFVLRSDIDACWYGVNSACYEADVTKHGTASSGDAITPPMIVELKNNAGYLSVLEAATTETYPGFCLQNKGNGSFGIRFNGGISSQTGDITSGWKVVNFADDLNGIVTNLNVYALQDAPDKTLYGDLSWLPVGHSTWSWGSENNQGAVNEANMARYIKAAADLGFPYNIIDDGWPAWENYEEKLEHLGAYGESMGVKQVLWSAQTAGTSGANKLTSKAEVDAFLDLMERTHMSGTKMDFWNNETDAFVIELQNYVLEEAAKRHMIVDFHGCAKATGTAITYPNELSREGVRGTENLGNADTMNLDTYAHLITTQLYTRYLGGHGDFTPGCTSAMEIGSLVCLDSPFMVISTSPERILSNEAVEFIKSMPTVWDETKVLAGSKVGTSAIYAKRNGTTWFVGGVFSGSASDVKVTLADFLTEKDGKFLCETWEDNGNGTKSKREFVVSASDVLTFSDKVSATGFAVRLTKLAVSQYGGKVGNVVTVAGVTEGNVYYTTDGSDPLKNGTLYTGGIRITDPCTLRVADEDGNALSCDFRKTTYYEYLDSPIAGEGTPNSGTAALYDYVDPTVSLTAADPVSAEGPNSKADWGIPQYDVAKFGAAEKKISFGGTNENNGYAFDHGIACGAKATFVYDVPDAMKQFTAVVGIDDGVYHSTEWQSASGVCTIQIDGENVFTSPILHAGESFFIDVAIPEGSKTLTILFTDGGNGNTCDDLALGNPGWN